VHPQQHDSVADNPRAAPSPRKRTAPFIDPRAFGLAKPVYSVPETLELLHIGRTDFYKRVKRGEIKITKRGKASLVFAIDIAAYLTDLRNAA
jgi:hypothetical protein